MHSEPASIPRVAIVGAGVAGLAAANKLQAAGLSVMLFDKGRRWGGRLARRQTLHGMFEHGAPGVAAPTAWLQAAVAQDALPGLNLHCTTAVTALHAVSGGWQLHTATIGPQHFTAVLLTVPVPQLAPLLPGMALPEAFEWVRYHPCWTLLCVPGARAAGDATAADQASANTVFATLRREMSPPEPLRYTAQASAEWSHAELESTPEAAAAALWRALCAHTGWQGPPQWMQAHRWRYAHVAAPLGVAQWRLAPGLHYASDACLGGGLAAAMTSGEAAAQALLSAP